MRLFLALTRARTLSDAARNLGVDQSTVSRRLASLEDTLGASLFDRGRSGVSATQAAEELLPVAEEIERAMARFAGAAESLERDVSGLVRVACPPDAAEVLIVPYLPGLLARFPGLRIDLQAGEEVVDLARRMAFELLAGARPFAIPLCLAARSGSPLEQVPSVAERCPELAAHLAELIQRALDHSPENRPTASEIAEAFAPGAGPVDRDAPGVQSAETNPSQRRMKQIVDCRFKKPSELVEGYPPKLEAIVLKALARNPDDRYQSALDLAHDLEEFARRERLPMSASSLSAFVNGLMVVVPRSLLVSKGRANAERGSRLCAPVVSVTGCCFGSAT